MERYTPKAVNAILPEETVYDHITDSDADDMDRISVDCCGSRIVQGELVLFFVL